MNVAKCFTPVLFASLVLGFGCGPDGGMIDPRSHGNEPGFSSAQYSAWSVPVNLGAVVNSASNDQGAFISRNGLALYFTSNRPGGFGGQDIYVSTRASTEEAWGPPQNVGPTINTSSNDASPTLSTDGHLLYFHSNRPHGAGNDLYVSQRSDKADDFGWEVAENLGRQVNSSGNERSLTLFEEDESEVVVVYFDSDRLEGAGGVDIYASTLNPDESFGPAVLLSEISSPSNDLLPFVRRDGLEIFFDSDRPESVGLRDIWFSTRPSTSSSWSAPVNLTVVNSPAGDQRAALSFDGTNLYLSSNRAGGFGDSDLYVSTRTKTSSDRDE